MIKPLLFTQPSLKYWGVLASQSLPSPSPWLSHIFTPRGWSPTIFEGSLVNAVWGGERSSGHQCKTLAKQLKNRTSPPERNISLPQPQTRRAHIKIGDQPQTTGNGTRKHFPGSCYGYPATPFGVFSKQSWFAFNSPNKGAVKNTPPPKPRTPFRKAKPTWVCFFEISKMAQRRCSFCGSPLKPRKTGRGGGGGLARPQQAQTQPLASGRSRSPRRAAKISATSS